jgi:hypothetical protein
MNFASSGRDLCTVIVITFCFYRFMLILRTGIPTEIIVGFETAQE